MNKNVIISCMERIEEVLRDYDCTLDSAIEDKYCYDLLCFHGVRLATQLMIAKQELPEEVSEIFGCFTAVEDVERTEVISALKELLECARICIE